MSVPFETLRRLCYRANRPLHPAPETSSAPTPLSPEERAKADAHRAQASRKLKMAKLLGDGELAEEARAALLEAASSLGRALAVESRMPEPVTLEDALSPPLSYAWKEAFQPLRAFAGDSTASWKSVAEVLAQI